MAWRKQLRALLGLLVLVLAIGIGWYVSRNRLPDATPVDSPRTDQKADLEASGDETIRFDPKTGKEIFRLKYDRLFVYTAENRARVVTATGIAWRGDKPMHFQAGEIDLKLKPGAGHELSQFDEMQMRGGVVIKSGPGADVLAVETAEGAYNDVTGIMTTSKPVKFQRGKMSGSGTGATFDRNRSMLSLLADAAVTLDTSSQGSLKVTSARAALAQAEHHMRFEQTVRMERDGRLIETDAAVANLTPDGNGLTSLELRGNSRITGGSGTGMPNMRAQDITITYGAESGLLERAVLMRAAHVELPEGQGRSLAAGNIDIGFGNDGNTVTALDATEAVELKIPAEQDQPAREVRAPKLEARGSVPKGLERANFTGGVVFREEAAARGTQEAVDREGRSESLVLGLDGGFGKIKDADFSGDVTFRDKDVTAKAPKARYGIDAKRIELRGGAGAARVTDANGTVDAKEIDLSLDPRKMSARSVAKNDTVKSTLTPGARKDRKEPRPSILEDNEDVNITSRALEYDGVADRAVYTGDARLWQGDTVIQAESVVLDNKTGNLEARKNVRAQFLIREEDVPGAKPVPAPKPTTLTAEELIYEESHRRATLREKATLRSADGDIQATRIEVFLQEDGNTLDRLAAYEKVKARLDADREATGAEMSYNARTRTYQMTGKPLTLRRRSVDKAGDAVRCEETEGVSLTFNRTTEVAIVAGPNGTRATPVPCGAGTSADPSAAPRRAGHQ